LIPTNRVVLDSMMTQASRESMLLELRDLSDMSLSIDLPESLHETLRMSLQCSMSRSEKSGSLMHV
jgi:hypothetical protein